MNIIKRSGEEAEFDYKKIYNAIMKANQDVSESDQITMDDAKIIAFFIERKLKESKHALNVEEIQDLVEDSLINKGYIKLAKEYIKYRYKRALVRKSNTTDQQILSLIDLSNEEIKQENSNKNPTINSVQRDYMAGEVSKDLTRRFFLDDDILKAHDKGIIHFHDMDYFAQKMYNCCLINLEDMLTNGTVISEVKIDPPKSFVTACTITTQIIAQVASSQYGGQSISIAHLAPFVQKDRDKFTKKYTKDFNTLGIDLKIKKNQELLSKFVERDVKREIEKGVQTMNYQVVTLMTTNGQAPFITFFMYLNEVPEGQIREDLRMIIEEIIEQRKLGVKNEQGVYVTPAFPKLIYVLEENNINEESRYWDVTKLAVECSAKRLVPDYISELNMKRLKEGNCFPCMGCRSFLSPYYDENGNAKFYGRFNQGVVTINLAYIALLSKKNMNQFWSLLDEYLELCHKALLSRHKRLEGTISDVAPILWQYGAISRLKKGETIDKLLHDGYSTISLGYAALYECVKYMRDCSHTDDKGKPFAIEIMKYMNDKCEKWKKEDNIGYGVYGTPLESTTYKFAKALQRDFGIIDGVTSKNYVTNSYHVHVTEKINAFEKLSFESEFQDLSLGGAISYVEIPDMKDNIEALLEIIKHIYRTNFYAETNCKSDYCMNCGYDGEIQVIKNYKNKWIWKCPNCGNEDQNTMSVARRTCGYIGSQYWNQGRTEEIHDRVVHVD